ncbi:hypothetical protein AAFF_G00378890 [Aldrovandia affinis]|uniref:Uncharacterized protein n=1 Tax=Aldrovandia affinis TaxID=143900 RepID=A0AAD7SFX1_9TELE|nr:hypothetical protein AAFF_G00378890 [Aldrovandia affinis]
MYLSFRGQAYYDLELADVHDYHRLKEEILGCPNICHHRRTTIPHLDEAEAIKFPDNLLVIDPESHTPWSPRSFLLCGWARVLA